MDKGTVRGVSRPSEDLEIDEGMETYRHQKKSQLEHQQTEDLLEKGAELAEIVDCPEVSDTWFGLPRFTVLPLIRRSTFRT